MTRRDGLRGAAQGIKLRTDMRSGTTDGANGEASMVASETKCAHDGCDCIGADEFCSDFCLTHGAGEHTHDHAEGGHGCGCGHAECGGAGI
jgi:hypothetical protein